MLSSLQTDAFQTCLYLVGVALLLLTSLHGLSAGAVSTKIIMGKKAKPGEFPYTVYLYKDGNVVCGGSLIEPQVVLTLNECASQATVGMDVIVGDRLLNVPDGEVVATVASVVLNPSANIGLIGLNEIMDTSLTNIGTITIDPIPLDQDLWKQTTCYLASYGVTEVTPEIKEATFKQKMKVRFVPVKKCGILNQATTICYQPKKSHIDLRACLQDQGSGIVCELSDQLWLLGINEERSCDSKFHRAVATHPFYDWVQANAPSLRSCSEPATPTGGSWAHSDVFPYPVNATAVLECDDGYRRSVDDDADATITCSLGSWSSTEARCEQIWNGLKVRWSPDRSDRFFGMPRTVADAEAAGWINMAPGVPCDGNPQLLGLRYWKDDDLTVILIFGPNGYIAGIATGIPRKYSPNPNNYPFKTLRGNPFIRDSGVFYLSTYFVDPATLCDGRLDIDFAKDGTGTGLWIQNGTDPVANSFLVPYRRADLAGTLWTEGPPCYPTMGTHYWYNIELDMNCEEFFPVFLLYNDGLLNAFGWGLIIDLQEPLYEHPTPESYRVFLDPVPTCLYDQGTITTFHIYLTDNPEENQCVVGG